MKRKLLKVTLALMATALVGGGKGADMGLHQSHQHYRSDQYQHGAG